MSSCGFDVLMLNACSRNCFLVDHIGDEFKQKKSAKPYDGIIDQAAVADNHQ